MNRDEIAQQLAAGTISSEEAVKMLLAKKDDTITYDISAKTNIICFRGIRKKFPISLYLRELKQIVKTYESKEFQEWVEENRDALENPKRKKKG